MISWQVKRQTMKPVQTVDRSVRLLFEKLASHDELVLNCINEVGGSIYPQ